MTNKYLRVNEVAKQLRVSPSAVRTYANQGKLQHSLTPYGHRVFTQENVDEFLGKPTQVVRVYYVRSSQGVSEQLKAQEEHLDGFYGEPATRVYSDKASGLNDKRPGLKQALTHAKKRKIHPLSNHRKRPINPFRVHPLRGTLQRLRSNR